MNIKFTNLKSPALKTLRIVSFTMLFGLGLVLRVSSQAFDTVTVRLANPDFNCLTNSYCLDVEFLGSQADMEVFGMNVRFFYDPEYLSFSGFGNFAGGYGPVSPNPPLETVSAPGIGYTWFGFGEPGTGLANYINGSIQLLDNNVDEILLDTEEWTYIFQICFTAVEPDGGDFCPPVVWDLNQDLGSGRTSYVIGSDGVVITIVDPNNSENSLATIEDVVNFNWQYVGSGEAPPYGEPIAETCVSTNCAPMITCPDDLVVDCSDSVNPEDLESMPTVDNICDGDLEFFFADSIATADQACPIIYTIYRTWVVFNECQLSDTCVQVIEVQDLTAPEIICAADTLLSCDAYLDCDASGFVNCFAPDNWTITENTGSVTITEEEAILISGNASEADTTTLCIVSPGNGTILFNWSYSTPDPGGPAWDRFGYSIDGVLTELTNVEQFMQFGHIAVTVAEGEEFCFVQLTSDGDFGAATTINASFIFSQVGVPEISDDCSLVSLTFEDSISDDTCGGNFVITRLWTVSDACGLTNTCEQIITVQDTVAPTMQCPTAEISVTCFSDIPSPETTIPDIITEDNCSSVEVVHVSDVVVDSTCQNQMTIVRTFMASDECGNTATCSQTISVFDQMPPVITCPADITVTCASGVPAPNTALVTVVDDNCGDVVVSHLSDNTTDFVCDNNFRIIRTYVATDGCGNSTACVQQIVVLDAQAPTITCPAPITVSCASEIPAPNAALVTSSDNCGGAVAVVFLNDVTNQGACPNQFTVTRTYQATDACGNTATCTQLITVNDQTPPTITCPANITINSGESEEPANTGTATATDNCGGTPTVTFADEIMPGSCEESYTIIRTWTATDACGSTSLCVQNIFVLDECHVPCVPVCPADIELSLLPGQCEAIVSYNVGRTGDCVVDATLLGFLPDGAWEFGNTPAGTGGTFNGAGLPSTVVLVSGDSGVGNGVTWYQTTVTTTATITFDWTYTTLDGPNFDRLGYVLNGTFFVLTNNAGALNQSGSASVPVNAGDVFGVAMFTLDGVFGPATGTFFNLVVPGQIESVVEIVSGPESGSALEAGEYTVEACVEDVVLGEVNCCTFNIIVHPFEVTNFTMVCNDHINISVDQNCEAYISTDMILEGGHYGCYDDYLVSVEGFGSGFGGVLVGNEAVGQTLVVTVTDPETGISCWGTILIEDKIPPFIECINASFVCGEEIPETPALNFQLPLYTINDTVPVGALGSLSYGGQQNHYFQVYDSPASDVNAISVRLATADPNVTFSGSPAFSVTATVFTLNNTAQPYDVTTGNRTLIGNSQTVNIPAGAPGLMGFNVPFDPGVVIPASSKVLLRVTVTQAYMLADAAGDGSKTWIANDATEGAPDTYQFFGFAQEKFMYLWVGAEGEDPYDNCGEVNLTYTDVQSGNECDGYTIVRTWIATDGYGNSSSCVQNIAVVPLDLSDVEFPNAFFGDCAESSHPSHTGWPLVNGSPLTDDTKLCNIFVGYWDQPFSNNCGGSYKIIRRWSIVDYCANEAVEGTQILTFEDHQGPILSNYPADIQVGTDFWYCYANVNLPRPTATDACGSDPITWSVSATNGVIVQFGNNYRLDQAPLGTTIVTWTATDACGNTSTATFTVTVVDDVAPVAICDHHTIVSLTNDGPSGVTLIPAEVFDDGSYDNCGPVTLLVRRMDNPGGRCAPAGTSGQIPNWTTNGACIDDIAQPGNPTSPDFGTVFRPCVPFFCCDVPGPGQPANLITVVLQVTDGAGNTNECMVQAEVQDKIPPFVITPPDIIVSCDFWFHYAEGIYNDDVAANPAGNGDGSLDEDPLSGIFGNIYDAFRYDESVRQPIIINDPGNTSLPQPYNWGLDGWANDNCEVFLRVQVVATDGCNKATPLPAGAPNNAIKLIERRFQVRDAQGNQPPGALRQRIWVVDFDPFTITDTQCGLVNQDDVRWPCDITLTDCPIGGLTPDNLEEILPQAQRVNARPQLNEDYCNLLAVTYEDTRFDFVDGTCYKILREWTVVDWCQFDLQEGTGIWKYTQVISVIDNNPPQFIEPAETQVLCVNESEGVTLPDNNQIYLGEANPDASSCSAHLHLKRRVRETCSSIVNYDVKIYPFNGTEYVLLKQGTTTVDPETSEAELYFNTRENTTPLLYRQNGVPYNSPWCNDYHRLLWTVQDGCGRENTLEYLIRIEDCKAPTPVCINGLSTVVMAKNGEVTIWAKDFNASSFDDCTPAADLLFSFDGDTYQPSMTYTCDNVPMFNVELAVQIWVADGGTDDNCNGQISWAERNKDFCTTTIVITDNAGACDTTVGSILGEIITEDVQSVEKVDVNLNVPGQHFPTYVTTENGQYNFTGIIIPQEFTIEAKRNDNHKNGVNTLDLVEIQKHLLGIKTLSSPYDIIAADANNSGSVSAVDLVELRRLILGIYNELPENKSWRFVNAGYTFADESNPWPFEEVIHMDALMGGMVAGKDFVAVKIGDVNNTVQANARQVLPRSGGQNVTFRANDRVVNPGEIVELTIRSADITGIEGYQFTLEHNGLEFRGIESGVLKMTEDHLGVFNGMITASWNDASGKAVSADVQDALFTLRFEAVQSGKLSEMVSLSSKVTEAGAYAAGETMDLALSFRSGNTDAEFALYQNEPNPVRGNTVIGYDVPAAGAVTLTVFDVTGKVVIVKDVEALKGYNTITINSTELPATGVLYYRLDAGEYTATKKMVVIE